MAGGIGIGGIYMKNMRQLANRLLWLLKHTKINEDDFRNQMNFTKEEWSKLLEGRLMLTATDIQEIAAVLHISVDDLYRYPQEESVDLVHCSGKATKEAEDFILDIFDMYCDLREAADGV